MWEAEQATAEGTTVYTVAFQAGTNGEQVLKAKANLNKKYSSINERYLKAVEKANKFITICIIQRSAGVYKNYYGYK